ncbi:MAG: hypothetical protein WAZ18_00280 [Alphaproteobacteria bacterium]
MQAMLIFALFGAFMAAIAGIISSATDSTLQMMKNQVAQARSYFDSAEKVWLYNTVPAHLQIPFNSCPDGTNYGVHDVKSYLCQNQIAKLAQWLGSQQGTKDPWKNDITGYVLRKEVPIYASAPDYVVSVPVTAMVLVSPGPDHRLAPALQADINALSGSSQIRDVLRIAAPNPTTCSVATDGSCDDIVHTFSDMSAQQNRWRGVQAAVDRIGSAAGRDYGMQFRSFQSQLPGIYAANIASLFDASGNLSVTASNINLWKSQGVSPPTFNDIDLNDPEERVRIGVDAEFEYITNSVSDGGSSLALAFAVSDSPGGYQDVLTISLSNSASPWGLWDTQGGVLKYQNIVSFTLVN